LEKKNLSSLLGIKPRILSCQPPALSEQTLSCHLTTRHFYVYDIQILCNRDFSQFSLHYIQPVQIPGYVPDDPAVRIKVGARNFSFAQNAQIQKPPIKWVRGVKSTSPPPPLHQPASAWRVHGQLNSYNLALILLLQVCIFKTERKKMQKLMIHSQRPFVNLRCLHIVTSFTRNEMRLIPLPRVGPPTADLSTVCIVWIHLASYQHCTHHIVLLMQAMMNTAACDSTLFQSQATHDHSHPTPDPHIIY